MADEYDDIEDLVNRAGGDGSDPFDDLNGDDRDVEEQVGESRPEVLGDRPLVPWVEDGFAPGQILLQDNGAWVDIVDAHNESGPLETDEDPFLQFATDDQGVPGDRPEAEASAAFETADGLESSRASADDEVLGDDEFAQRMKLEEAAATVSGGNDLAQMVGVEEAQKQKAISEAPYRRINPPSAYQALLGGTGVVFVGQDPQQVIFWQGENVEALPVSIMLWPQTLTSAGGVSVRPFARIDFGTRDGRVRVDVDLGTGTQLCVPASTVYVSVGVEVAAGVTGTISSRLSASIGFYPIVRTAPITRTSYLDSIAAAATQTITRPAFANSIIGFERLDTTAQYTILFNANLVNVSRHIIAANTYLTAPIYLSNDITEVVVTNNGGGTDQARLVWGLAL